MDARFVARPSVLDIDAFEGCIGQRRRPIRSRGAAGADRSRTTRSFRAHGRIRLHVGAPAGGSMSTTRVSKRNQRASNRRTTALRKALDAMPGATANALASGRSLEPAAVLYKVAGKMFAIVSLRGSANVIVKCDPYSAQTLRERYSGVGHRSHLDRRFWISIDLDADVPMKEVKRLAEHSYQLVFAKLTRKQQTAINALRAGD